MTFRSRLIVAFLALTLGTTAIVGLLAYRAAEESVRAVSLRVVGIVAQDRRQALVQRLDRQRRRATRFLAQTPACTQLPLDLALCQRAVRAFAVEGELLGATILDDERAIVSVNLGDPALLRAHPQLRGDVPLPPGPHRVRFAMDPPTLGYYDLAMPVPQAGTVRHGGPLHADWLVLRYAVSPSDALFGRSDELGKSGETFLADAAGHPLTPLRFQMHMGHGGAIDSRPMLDCLRGRDGAAIDPDYHDAPIVHGYRYVPEIGGGCIMAHMSQPEAQAPLREIRDRVLIIGASLALLSLFVSLVLAREIAAPLTMLVRDAGAVARGEPTSPLVNDGVPEVRTLARAFASMTDAVQRRTEEREAALASRARFYHAMSHELRTPLNAIAGYLDLMLAGVYGEMPAPAADALARSQRSARHLRDLIDDVLDLAKIEAGRIDIRHEPVDVNALFDDLLATLQPMAAARGVVLRVQCATDASAIRTDPRRLRQILINLVSNAIKFAPGTPVVIDCRAAHPGTVIEVRDRGPGIAREDQDRIFEEYVQLEGGDASGTGLGLAISRRLADALGGSLSVESEVGTGTTFRLHLP